MMNHNTQIHFQSLAVPRYDRHLPKFETLLSSEEKNWQSLQVYCYHLAAQADFVPAPLICAHTIPVVLKGSGHLSGIEDGKHVHAQVHPGSMGLKPNGMPAEYCWTDSFTVAHLHLAPTLISSVARELNESNAEHVELIPQPFFCDPLIEQLCLCLISELETGGLLGNLFVDTVAETLAVHLVRHYSSVSTTNTMSAPGLSHHQMRLVREYMDEFLATDINLCDLAALTGLSATYFVKQFKRSAGMPPHQYLIRQRLEKAKTLLLTSELTVAEVSHMVGFFDQSHFIRHFKSVVGTTPKSYRNSRSL